MKKAQAFKEMKGDHLKCRSLQHAWDTRQAVLVRYDGRECVELTLRCMRRGCRTERVDTATRSGEVLNRRYYHPDMYLIEDLKSWGGRAEFNQNVRRELYHRLLGGE